MSLALDLATDLGSRRGFTAAMTWTSWVTFGIALLGAGFGVFNIWQSWRDRSVRIRVRVTQAVGLGGPAPTCLSIGVTNLGSFPITIVEVGLTVDRPRGSLPKRAMIPPQSIINGQLPMKVEPRHSDSVIGWASELPAEHYDHAYARTSGGEIGFGTSPALLQWVSSIPRR